MTDETPAQDTPTDYADTLGNEPDSTSMFPVIRDEIEPPAAAEPRSAHLRLVAVEPWTVTRVAFAISVALMIVSVVAVTIFWLVLQVTGVWGQIDDAVNAVLSNDNSSFSISEYLGFGRLVGISLILSAVNVVFMTALAAIGAHLYNAAAGLLGGIEVSFSDQ